MANNSTNMLLSKVMIGMALVGGIGLLIIDEYVAVDMVQSAGASIEARAPQSPSLLQEKQLISAQSMTATEFRVCPPDRSKGRLWSSTTRRGGTRCLVRLL